MVYNILIRHFDRIPYDLYAERRTKDEANNIAGFARYYMSRSRVVPDTSAKGKWCVYATGAKNLPPMWGKWLKWYRSGK